MRSRGKVLRRCFQMVTVRRRRLAGCTSISADTTDRTGISQDIGTVEGSFWHGILHRQEPDPDNAKYWFRRVGEHPIFSKLRDAAIELGFAAKQIWDPFAFIDYCEAARRKPGSREEQTAMAIQLAEWQLLFDYCARPAR